MYDVVKVVQLAPIKVPNKEVEPFVFRVEVLRKRGSKNNFHARVYRMETYRLRPTFPQKSGKPFIKQSDEPILVEDFSQDWENIKGKSAEETIKKVIRKIEEIFQL